MTSQQTPSFGSVDVNWFPSMRDMALFMLAVVVVGITLQQTKKYFG